MKKRKQKQEKEKPASPPYEDAEPVSIPYVEEIENEVNISLIKANVRSKYQQEGRLTYGTKNCVA